MSCDTRTVAAGRRLASGNRRTIVHISSHCFTRIKIRFAEIFAALVLSRRSQAMPPVGSHSNSTADGDKSWIRSRRGTAPRYFTRIGARGKPLWFHHGWPLSSDDWDNQMMFFLEKGYRVIAHDRRGHGRSTQTATGNDMDTYVSDVAELAAALDVKDVIHMGTRPAAAKSCATSRATARDGSKKAITISAVPPVMVKSAKNPPGNADQGVR